MTWTVARSGVIATSKGENLKVVASDKSPTLTLSLFDTEKTTAKEIYEYLMARAEEDEKARDDVSGMDHEGGRVLAIRAK